MNQESSIFTKIIRGEIPCHKIYEDETVFAFLDIHPLHEGHTLVVPKQQIAFIWDMEDAGYQALMQVVKMVARRQREVLGAPYVGELVVGTDVPHAHVHVVPFEHPTEVHGAFASRDTIEPDHDALAQIAAKLAF